MKPVAAHRLASRLSGAFLLAAGLVLGGPAAAKGTTADAQVAGQVLLRLRSTADLPSLLLKYGLSLRDSFGSRPIFLVSVVGGTPTRDVIAALALEPAVLDAEPNVIHSAPEARVNTAWAIGQPSDYIAQWAPQALRLPQAWTRATGQGVTVAVLDTGIDATHPAFASRLVPGFDFVDFDTDPTERVAASVAYGHGTHVAGLVALAAPGAKIMPLRVLDEQGRGNAWVLAEAMLYAAEHGAQVINMSLGSTSRTELFNAMALIVGCNLPEIAPQGEFNDPGYGVDRQRCSTSVGTVTIAAAGNDASKQVRQFPAAEGTYGLLPVTASNAQRRIASFANFGTWVDLAAPGEGITSAVPVGSIAGASAAQSYATWSGTSMAAPLTAGVAALVRSSAPTLPSRDVVERLLRSSAPLCGTDTQRLLDAGAALGIARTAFAACR